MIFFVTTERFARIVTKFIRNTKGRLKDTLRSLTYEELFFERAGPAGHYIFTDFDRLSRYERDTAAGFTLELRRAAPDAKILNDPTRAMERTPLLAALHRGGINDFAVTRVDTGDLPPQFPVFIRADDGYGLPDTGLIETREDFERALSDLENRGVPLKGRVAIGFAAEKGPNGRYRKYGAFNIGGTIVPQHLMQSDDWVVRRHVPEHTSADRLDESDQNIAEEMDYVTGNPHRKELLAAFRTGKIDFGRADYGIVGGRIQIYEINTNPGFPRFDLKDHRSERRDLLLGRLIDAFRAVDVPIGQRGRIYFKETRPRAHNLHLPRTRLPLSLARRVGDRLLRNRFRRDAPPTTSAQPCE